MESKLNTTNNLKIAIDGMGGDFAPQVPVEGAILAAKRGASQILLVGDEEILKKELSKYETEGLPIKIIPSEGIIHDHESPALALRQKPKSSILVATNLVKTGMADAIISMGSSGATMAAAVVILGTINGIERPAIGGPIIGSAPNQVILDLGSNIDCKPSNLVGFGVLGSVFSQVLLGIESPKIGILSVGSEEGKGNGLVKETTKLFHQSGLNFIGNVEGNDLLTGRADVVVCDGFVGNVILKLVEGFGRGFAKQLKETLSNHMNNQDLERLLNEFSQKNNIVDSRGGGPVFGVNGVSIIGHGSSSAKTVDRAVDLALMCINTKLIEEMNNQTPDIMSTISN